MPAIPSHHPHRPARRNRLSGETSPYLLQHADNPVAWFPWGEEALTLARTQDKPILLSIGYSACHWCHVMAHESFEDDDVAAVMNERFINIKVDREERPDLDQIYQTAHQMLTGRHGGWPLTLFLAPDGTPFFGGTYFPREARYGLGGFVDICRQVADAWRDTPRAKSRRRIPRCAAPSPERPHRPPTPSTLDAAPVAALRAVLLGSFDRTDGGFGGAPKFPHPTDLAFLLRRPQDAAAHEAALFTLSRMAAGGIHDQLGGGFCRYSVDERWEIPHFEKMLYDNGPLLGLYADAWALTGDDNFRRVAEGIVSWLLREMTSPEGAFYSSLDADSEGEEGKFYVWDRARSRALADARRVGAGGTALGTRGTAELRKPALASQALPRHWRQVKPALLESARAKLFAAREKRIRPGLDDKVLTAWNALMIEGLAHAARLLERPDWLSAARAALAYLQATHWQNGRLLATSRHGRAQLPAYLDDYAYLLAALLELLQAEFRAEDLAFATQLADALLAHFEDKRGRRLLLHRPRSRNAHSAPQDRPRWRNALRQRRRRHCPAAPRPSPRGGALPRSGTAHARCILATTQLFGGRLRNAAVGPGGSTGTADAHHPARPDRRFARLATPHGHVSLGHHTDFT